MEGKFFAFRLWEGGRVADADFVDIPTRIFHGIVGAELEAKDDVRPAIVGGEVDGHFLPGSDDAERGLSGANRIAGTGSDFGGGVGGRFFSG